MIPIHSAGAPGSSWQRARNFLCIRLDQLGDVLMCTPAMRAIRDSVPGCTITLLTSASGAAAVPFIAEIDAVITYDAPWMKNVQAHAADTDQAMIATLQAGGFDAAVIFTSYSQSALPAAMLCYLSNIPIRLAHCRENPYQLLTHWVADPEPQQDIRHEVRRQLDLVAGTGCHTRNEKLSFAVKEADLAAMRLRLRDNGIEPASPWILIHPGATATSRRYPANQWAQVIDLLGARLGLPLVMSGAATETALIDDILNACKRRSNPVISLAGQLDLGQLGAAIALADLALSNNTGPAHMAAAIGTPLVNLYALTNPQHGPWQVQSRVLFHDVPCRFCYKSICPQGHHDCLVKVTPQQVVEAACSLLQSARSSRNFIDAACSTVAPDAAARPGVCASPTASPARRPAILP